MLLVQMPLQRWKGSFLLLVFLISRASGENSFSVNLLTSSTLHLACSCLLSIQDSHVLKSDFDIGGSVDAPADLGDDDPKYLSSPEFQAKGAKRVLLYDMDQQILKALANTAIEVVVGIDNNRLPVIGEFEQKAMDWINEFVVPALPEIKITHIVVGRDVLGTNPDYARFMIPSIQALQKALASVSLLSSVKISSLISVGQIGISSEWQSMPVLNELLQILNDTESALFITPAKNSTMTNNALHAAAYHALQASGFTGVNVVVITDEREFMITQARNAGSNATEPLRRELATGSSAGQFCVANPNADPKALQTALNWACGPGGANCAAIQPNGPCYKANNLPALASYAFNDYYHSTAANGATCSFDGTAMVVSVDPSSGSCVFAGSSLTGGAPTGTLPTSTGNYSGGFISPPGGALTPMNDGSATASGRVLDAPALLLAAAAAAVHLALAM